MSRPWENTRNKHSFVHCIASTKNLNRMNSNLYFLLAGIMTMATFAAFTVSKKGEVRHIVVFKYKASATPEQINEVSTAFKSLKDKIPGIVWSEHGKKSNRGKVNRD